MSNCNHCKDDPYKHEIMGKTIKEWFDGHDKFSFISHLSHQEQMNYQAEQARVQRDQDALVSKYNKLVSDRVSRQVLVDLVLINLEISTTKKDVFKEIFDKLDNKMMQDIVNVLRLAQKEKKDVNKS